MKPTAATRLVAALCDRFDALTRALVRVSEVITTIIAFFITGAMILGVFFRFVLNSSLGWTDEVSALLLAVMMFLVIGIGFHERVHIGVGVLIERLPLAGQKILDVVLHLISGIFFVLIAYTGLKVAESGMSMTLATIRIPRGLFFYAMPIGGAFAAMVCINNIFKVLRGIERPSFRGMD